MKEHFEDSNNSLESKFKQKYLLQFMYTRIILLKRIKYLLRKQLQNEIYLKIQEHDNELLKLININANV